MTDGVSLPHQNAFTAVMGTYAMLIIRLACCYPSFIFYLCSLRSLKVQPIGNKWYIFDHGIRITPPNNNHGYRLYKIMEKQQRKQFYYIIMYNAYSCVSISCQSVYPADYWALTLLQLMTQWCLIRSGYGCTVIRYKGNTVCSQSPPA